MATWKADVFVNSQVGRISTEVEASTFSGAKQQIYAKHGDVQQIANLRQVTSSSGSSGGSDIGGSIALIGLVAVGWAFFSFTPWILMGIGGAFGTWIGQLATGQTIEEYSDRDDDSGHTKAAITLALALILGGVGFVQGDSIKKGFDAPSTPSQVEQAK
jgi:hypothetical protein